jgi:hypothetical protein
MHSRAIPLSAQDSTDGLKQGTLDSMVTREARMPNFTTKGLLDFVIELVVSEDNAFRLIDKGPFRRLLRYCRPSLRDTDVPH